MIEMQPKELLDSLAVDEVAGRHLDLRAVHERAGQIRRRRVLGTVLSGAGLAACVALAFALATNAPHRLADTPGTGGRGSRTNTSYGVTWTSEPGPAWTPAPPNPSPAYSGGLPGRPLPSPSPGESPAPGDRPAYRIPAAAGLTKAEVPARMILWEDTGPTLDRAHARPGLCPDPWTGDERLGAPIIAGRVWRWNSGHEGYPPDLVHSVSGFAPGTGHARFLEVWRNVGPCYPSDRDPEIFSGRARGAEFLVLVTTMREDLPGGQFVFGMARVRDVLTTVEAKVKVTRPVAVDLIERLLVTAVRHLAEAHVPPPQDKWTSPVTP